MRWAFSIVGFLVVLGIIVLLMSQYLDYSKQALDVQRDVTPQVQQTAGMAPSGERVDKTYTLVGEGTGSRPSSLLVTKLDPTSPMVSYYGLKQFDSITQIGAGGSMMRVRDANDVEMAKALVMEAYQRRQPLVVRRDGAEIELPVGPKTSNPGAAGGTIVPSVPTPGAPASPPAAAPQQSNPRSYIDNVLRQAEESRK